MTPKSDNYYDNSHIAYSVNKSDGAVDYFDYYGRLIFDKEYSIGEAAKNKIPVDTPIEIIEKYYS